MQRRNEARNSLVRALSRVVLERETIWRHAQSSLLAPELVEVPSPTSAFALWNAVLDRAEAEDSAHDLVLAVLDEHPGADAVRATFGAWRAGAVHDIGVVAVGSHFGAFGRALAGWGGWLVAAGVLTWHLVPPTPEAPPQRIHFAQIPEPGRCAPGIGSRVPGCPTMAQSLWLCRAARGIDDTCLIASGSSADLGETECEPLVRVLR